MGAIVREAALDILNTYMRRSDAEMRPPATKPKENIMSTLLIVLVVVFVLGGGFWGYSRRRR